MDAQKARWKNTGSPDTSAKTERERDREREMDEVRGVEGWRES